jgi:hypothetical protein
MKYQKFIMQVGNRTKLMQTPAVEWYPDVNNALHMNAIKSFHRKHKL